MAKASTPTAAAETTILAHEAAHFGALAAQWWDPKGSSAMLHRLNPVRLSFIRRAIDAHWGSDPASFRPLTGKRALDMGCGAGLLTEPLARLGAAMTGVDAAAENIEAARSHAEAGGLSIDYRAGGIEQVSGERFDLVASLEVIEHVADPAAFIAGLAGALADDGLMILSTPNRTAWSRIAMVTVAEGLGAIPRGTHDWDRFLTPTELEDLLAAQGLSVVERRGIQWSPTSGFTIGEDERLNYILSARRG